MAGEANSLESVPYALFTNSTIAMAKGVAAGITGFGAMLAEAIHSVTDAGNQLLLIPGLRQTRKLPTDDHPLAFGESIYFLSFLVAIKARMNPTSSEDGMIGGVERQFRSRFSAISWLFFEPDLEGRT